MENYFSLFAANDDSFFLRQEKHFEDKSQKHVNYFGKNIHRLADLGKEKE